MACSDPVVAKSFSESASPPCFPPALCGVPALGPVGGAAPPGAPSWDGGLVSEDLFSGQFHQPSEPFCMRLETQEA